MPVDVQRGQTSALVGIGCLTPRKLGDALKGVPQRWRGGGAGITRKMRQSELPDSKHRNRVSDEILYSVCRFSILYGRAGRVW
jgi:hypothetical protein